MKNLPNVASKWISIDSTIFKIEQLKIDDNRVWAYYINTKTGQHHSCLVEAFLSRFKEQLA